MKFLRAWAQSPGPSAGGGGGGPGPSAGLSGAKAGPAALSMPADRPGSPAAVVGAGPRRGWQARSERARPGRPALGPAPGRLLAPRPARR